MNGPKVVLLQKVLGQLDAEPIAELLGQRPSDSDGTGDPWEPLFAKIAQAARGARTKDVLKATSAPFGKRNAGV